MNRTCQCGNPVGLPDEELGCIECGRACCPACAVALESVWYCAPCARRVMDASAR